LCGRRLELDLPIQMRCFRQQIQTKKMRLALPSANNHLRANWVPCTYLNVAVYAQRARGFPDIHVSWHVQILRGNRTVPLAYQISVPANARKLPTYFASAQQSDIIRRFYINPTSLWEPATCNMHPHHASDREKYSARVTKNNNSNLIFFLSKSSLSNREGRSHELLA